jgi:hypothetical protein
MLSSILTRASLIFSFLLLLVPCLALAADEDFSVYHSQSRPAEELVNAAQGLVSNVRIRHLNDKIVIYGSKSGREAALKLMKELDAPALTYRVHVRAVGKGTGERQAQAIEGVTGNENVKVGKRRSGVLKREGGGTISIGGVAGTAESETVDHSTQGAQSITLLDGSSGSIMAYDLFPRGALKVKLRSQGKNGAHLELQQQNAGPGGGQLLATDIDVRLGEWRTIGGVQHQNESANSEILGKSKSASASKQDIQIMVELDKSGRNPR